MARILRRWILVCFVVIRFVGDSTSSRKRGWRGCGLPGESGRGELGRLTSESVRRTGFPIGGFREDVSHGGARETWFLAFSWPISGCSLRNAKHLSDRGCLSLPGWLSRVERRGRGSRIDGFWGWMVVVIVVGGAAGGLRRVGTRKVNGITNRKKVVTPYDL